MLDCSPTSKLPLFFRFGNLRTFRILLDQLRFLLFLLTASIIDLFAFSQTVPQYSISNNKLPSQDPYLPLIWPNPHTHICTTSSLQIEPQQEFIPTPQHQTSNPHTYQVCMCKISVEAKSSHSHHQISLDAKAPHTTVRHLSGPSCPGFFWREAKQYALHPSIRFPLLIYML